MCIQSIFFRNNLVKCHRSVALLQKKKKYSLKFCLGKCLIDLLFSLFYRDIDKVDELMQDIAEQQELADEISTAISKPVGFGEEFDEVHFEFFLCLNETFF